MFSYFQHSLGGIQFLLFGVENIVVPSAGVFLVIRKHLFILFFLIVIFPFLLLQKIGLTDLGQSGQTGAYTAHALLGASGDRIPRTIPDRGGVCVCRDWTLGIFYRYHFGGGSWFLGVPASGNGEFLRDDHRLGYGHRDNFHRFGIRRGSLRVTGDNRFRCARSIVISSSSGWKPSVSDIGIAQVTLHPSFKFVKITYKLLSR